MNLKICGSLQEIRSVLMALATEPLESNATGTINCADYDYDFVDADDLYSDDSDLPVINPNM